MVYNFSEYSFNHERTRTESNAEICVLLTIESNYFGRPLIAFGIELLHLKLIELLAWTDYFKCAPERNAVEVKTYCLLR